jgi:hypothetical protein
VTAQRANRADVAAVLHDDGLRFNGFLLELTRADGANIGDELALGDAGQVVTVTPMAHWRRCPVTRTIR